MKSKNNVILDTCVMDEAEGEHMNFSYTDIHCHILPRVDDGSKSIEESLQMLSVAYEEGCRRLFLTPHYEFGRNRYEPEQLDEIYEELKKRALQFFPDMKLYLGNELLYETGVLEDVKKGFVHTMAGTRYLLVEFETQILYTELYKGMKELMQARYRPIIAHVERFQCLTGHLDRIAELAGMGIYFQMNAESILGGFLDENVRWCRRLLKHGYISFLGTDAHNLNNRAPHMRDALEWMYKKLDRSYVDAVIQKYPAQMLENEYLG